MKIYDAEHNDGDKEDEDEEDKDEDKKMFLLCQQEWIELLKCYWSKHILIYDKCIDIIGSVINCFLQDASEATSFSFTLMEEGLDKEGSIKMYIYVINYLFFLYHSNFNDRSSVGRTAVGKTFMSAHKDWEEGVSNTLKEFLCLRHYKLYNFIFDIILSYFWLALGWEIRKLSH